MERVMKRKVIFFLVLIALAGSLPQVLADSWPKLIGGKTSIQCNEALRIADALFQSDASVLYAPPVIPSDLKSVLVLGPDGLDISGGDAIKIDHTEFDKIPISEEKASRSIYWQKKPGGRYRLVVRENPVGWRGDMYSLYITENKIEPKMFLAEIDKTRGNSGFEPVISDTWRPPLVFRSKVSGELWFIEVGEPYQFFADWRVYGVDSTGAKSLCTVRFRPQVHSAKYLLPQPVQRLAVLLDQTIGQDKDEGTLQPTARLRMDVEWTWANAALRPWALKEKYNTRDEVDASLKKWTQKGHSYQKHYQAIQQQYTEAERSLTEYYKTTFRKSPRDAKELAIYALDIAYRSYYTFQRDDPNNYFRLEEVNRNPWRKQ